MRERRKKGRKKEEGLERDSEREWNRYEEGEGPVRGGTAHCVRSIKLVGNQPFPVGSLFCHWPLCASVVTEFQW